MKGNGYSNNDFVKQNKNTKFFGKKVFKYYSNYSKKIWNPRIVQYATHKCKEQGCKW